MGTKLVGFQHFYKDGTVRSFVMIMNGYTVLFLNTENAFVAAYVLWNFRANGRLLSSGVVVMCTT